MFISTTFGNLAKFQPINRSTFKYHTFHVGDVFYDLFKGPGQQKHIGKLNGGFLVGSARFIATNSYTTNKFMPVETGSSFHKVRRNRANSLCSH